MEASSFSPISSRAEPQLFKHGSGDNMWLWVHPDTVGCMELVRTIEENGGSMVDTPGMANFAIVGENISNEQLKFLVMEQLNTIILSANWIQDSTSRGEIQPYLKYVLLVSEEDFEDYYNRLADANKPANGHGDTQSTTEGQQDPQNEDDRFFLDAAKNLLSQDHSRPLEDVHCWCASEVADKGENFWANLSGPDTRLRGKADTLRTLVQARDRFKVIRNISPAAEEHANGASNPPQVPHIHKKRPYRPSYSAEEHLQLIQYLATNPPGSRATVWQKFHEKYPHRTAGAWQQQYTAKKEYFDQQVQAHKSGKSFEFVTKDTTKTSAVLTSNSTSDESVGAIISQTPNEVVQFNGASTTGKGPSPSIRGRGYAFTGEEKQSMKEYWEYCISKQEGLSASAIWETYATLHPHRSPAAWSALARRHPELFPTFSTDPRQKDELDDDDELEDDDDEDRNHAYHGEELVSGESNISPGKFQTIIYDGEEAPVAPPRTRPYTEEEEQTLVHFLAEQGESITGHAWVRFQREHPSRSTSGWKSRYQFNKAYYKAEADKLRSAQLANTPDGPATSTVFSARAVPLRWRSPPSLGPLNIRAQKRVWSLDLPDLPVKRRRSDGDRRVHFEALTQDELNSDFGSSRPSTLKVKPMSSTSFFNGSSRGSLPKSVTPERSTSASLPGFTRQDLQVAMAWVASRESPLGLHDNVSSWETFAEGHTSHDAEGWLRLYYYHFDLFKGMEAQINCFT